MRYRRKIWRFLLSVPAAVLLRGVVAQAAEPPVPSGVRQELITVDLESKVDEFPSDICVISDLKSPTSGELKPPVGNSWLQEVWAGYENRSGLNTDEKLSIGTESIDRCERNEQFCSPEFHLETADQKKHYFIECTGNSADRKINNRIVILRVYGVSTKNEDMLTQPYITDVSLNKNKVTFNLNYIKSAAEMRTYAVIAGGHYAESEVRAIENKKARLPLISRCQVHELILPSYAGSAAASVWLSADPEDKIGKRVCDQIEVGPNRSIRVGLPYERHNQRRTVWVETGSGDKHNFQSYSGQWYDFAPPPFIKLRQKSISFQWKRHCMYPGAKKHITEWLMCPDVTLVEGDQDKCALQIADNRSGICYYRCEPKSHTFDLEAHVRFTGNKELGLENLAWTEELRYGNQVLDGYVPLDRRHVMLDFHKWNEGGWSPALLVGRRAAGIHKIQFLGASGKPFYYVFEKGSNTKIPDEVSIDMAGAECGHVVSYRFIGDRTYAESSASIQNGRLVLESPKGAEEEWKFRVYGGGAAQYSVYSSDEFSDPWKLAVMLTGAVHWRPITEVAWAVEGRYSFMFGAQNYYPLRLPSRDGQTRVAQNVWYVRHIVDGAALYVLVNNDSGELALGGGPGIIFGSPLWFADSSRVSDLDVSASALLLLQGRLKSIPRWTLEGGARMLFFDDVYAHDTDFVGGSRGNSLGGVRGIFELRLGYTL